jgi:hypothetical protein
MDNELSVELLATKTSFKQETVDEELFLIKIRIFQK